MTAKPISSTAATAAFSALTSVQRALAEVYDTQYPASMTAATDHARRLKPTVEATGKGKLVLTRDIAPAYQASLLRHRVQTARSKARYVYEKGLQLRLNELVAARVEAAARQSLRIKPGATVIVARTVPGEAPDAFSEKDLDWTRVNKGKDTWATAYYTLHVRPSRQRLTLTRKLGSAAFGDFLVLGGTAVYDVDGMAIYSLVIARPGRGYNPVVEGRYATVFPGQTTLHRNLDAAMRARPPASTQPLTAADKEALAALTDFYSDVA